MGSGNFYLLPVNTNGNVKKGRSLRSLLIGGALFLGLPFVGMAQPTFNNGNSQTIPVCQGSGATDISSYLSATDTYGPLTENDTWDVSSYPSNGGTLSGTFPYTTNSNGGTLILPPNTFVYTPSTTGNDVFVIKVYDANTGDTQYMTITMVVSPLPSLTLGAPPQVCQGASSVSISYSALSQLGPTTSTFAGGMSIWQVPPGVTSINFDVQGAVGGNDSHSPAGTSNPGAGARVQGTLSVNPGEILNLYAGGQGGNGTVTGATGGFNGGGNATFYFFGCGGAGGGASDIRVNGTGLNNRVVVAGGGGGNGWDAPGPSCGGNGGQNGSVGCSNVGGGYAGGGLQTSGGAGAPYSGWTSGSNGGLGTGGNGSPQGVSGGGGGGYYGGGGGVWSGGGGGSSYADITQTTGVTYTSGYNIGTGVISLNYMIQGTYSITWDNGTNPSILTGVNAASLTASPIVVPLPTTATPGTYTGELTIADLNTPYCTSLVYPISFTINPTPDVIPMSDTSYCNGDNTNPVVFSGSVTPTTFNWTNTDSTIGLATSGSGNINQFTATNNTTNPVTALITVTPVANGCTGVPVTSSITVNPTPLLSSTLTATPICDSTIFNYTPVSATGGASYTWYRPSITDITVGGSNSPASGSNNPMETLVNSSSNAIVVPYTYQVAANGCVNSQNVNVTVYPMPTLNSPLAPGYICNNTVFSYPPSSLTSGVSYMWNRNPVMGVSNSAATGTNNPNETLTDTTAAPVNVPYVYTLTLLGTSCTNTETVIVTVNPTPMLNSGLNPTPLCNDSMFVYNPSSFTTGAGFAWSRGAQAGISNPPNSGTTPISEPLFNTTANTIGVVYVYTITAYGCSNVEDVVDSVYPTPTLSHSLTLTPTVCDSSLFSYVPTSATPGTTFTWTRAAVAGISNGPGASFGNPDEYLSNTTSNPVIATYIFSLMANGCPANMENVNLTVYPKPTLSTSLTPPQICDSTTFSYPPASNTAGSTFAWERPYIPGIYAVQQSGTNDPDQQLINSTYVVVNVTYVYTITANGCSNTQNVVVAVNPTPKLNPPFTATVCSGSPFVYNPTSYTPGTIFAWDRPAATNVGPATSFTSRGSGQVDEILTDEIMTPVTTEYFFQLSVNGCVNLYPQEVEVVINPAPGQPSITTYPPSTVCAGTMYQNFGTSIVPEGIEYNWTATNATVVEEGSNHQYALVTFNTPGTSVVTLSSNVNNYGCDINSTYTVNVTEGNNGPAPRIIYYNGQFICLENDNNTYQWGYDDAHTMQPTTLTGQIDQNYNNSSPDFADFNYWCVTTTGDCSQKSYYNAPTGIAHINGNSGGDLGMRVYPNPATQMVNVELTTTTAGEMQVELVNLLGQKLNTQAIVNNKASFDVSELPAGCYLLDCYQNGIKVGTSKFIKN